MSKVGRNDPCPCGSGKKYKKCCLAKDEETERRIVAVEDQLPSDSFERYHVVDDDLDDAEPFDAGFDDDKEDDWDQVNLRERARRVLFDHWSKAEIEEYTTEEIVAKLVSLGIAFDEEKFRVDALRLMSAQRIGHEWTDALTEPIEGRDGDFPWMSAQVLLDRLCPEIPYIELLEDRIDDGYSLAGKDCPCEACDLWLSVWEPLVHHYSAGHRSIDELDELWEPYQYFSNWCQDLEAELLTAGVRNPVYFEKRIAYCSEFVVLFPDTGGNIPLNMRRAVAESWFELGNAKRGEAEFKKLTEEHPDWLWGYMAWGDAYAYGKPPDFDRAEVLYRQAQARGLEDRHGIIGDRLSDLATERRKNRFA